MVVRNRYINELTRAENVVVFCEPSGVPRAQVPLGEQRDRVVRSVRRAYPYTKPAHVDSIRQKLQLRSVRKRVDRHDPRLTR